METTIEILKGQDLKNYIENTFKQIKKVCNEKNYRYSYDPSTVIIDLNEIYNWSWTRIKHVNRKILYLNRNMSLRRINTTTHWLLKHILNDRNNLNVRVSEKEELIQRKRKEWKEAQLKANLLLEEYKKEKGDFYKTK